MQIIADRRALHQIPELDRNLPKTIAYLHTALASLHCQVFSPMSGALCAWFDFGADHTIAFRSDADALPISEVSNLPFTSVHPGQMHACGHDGHMAILLELARRLSARPRFPHNILLVFQPAEETTGGAKDLCETGIFEQYNVCAIFGLHLWPRLEKGIVASRRRAMMSRSCEIHVQITGRSAHIAKSQDGIDALAAGVDFYRRAMAAESALPSTVFRLLKFGRFASGTVGNAISACTIMAGSLRAFEDDVFFSLQASLRQAAWAVECAFGCTVTLEMNDGYPAVWNPDTLYDRALSAVHFHQLELPSMITEDFSWYQKKLPGLFFFLGTGDSPPLHADNFNFDETILMKGADFFEKLAENFR